MNSFRTGAVLATIMVCIAGCVSSPARVAPVGEHADIQDHVGYLAQPALAGRKPWSRGSLAARRYIIDHFKTAGLRPWGEAETFEQSVYIGTNVIGILPGSDPALAHEVVLVSAHYDHVGGKMLGACDNASGVAAMLELVDRFAQSPPRRSICFAAFDCEEWGLFGSFAFTKRDDFNPASLVAVVNVDMLGRDFLDVVDRSLIVSGTQGYPETRRVVSDACASRGMHFMPLGPDFIGPRSDHVAFLEYDIPCVFFTCGVFDGYHSAADTVDRLDVDALADSTDVVYSAVRTLAMADAVEHYVAPDGPDRDELAALASTLDLLNTHAGRLKLSKETQQSIATFLDETIAPHMDGAGLDAYTFEDRERIAEALVRALGAGLGDRILGLPDAEREEPDPDRIEQLCMEWCLSGYFARHPDLFIRAYGGLVTHVLEHRPIPLIKPMPLYAFDETLQDGPRMVRHEDGSWEFMHVPFSLQVDIRMNRFNLLPHGSIAFAVRPQYCQGSQDELVDFLLLNWFGAAADDKAMWRGALVEAGAVEPGADVETERHAWLRASGCGTDEAWVLHVLESGNPWLINACLRLLRENDLRTPAAIAGVRAVAADTQAVPWVRQNAIASYSTMDDGHTAETLAALSADTTVVECAYRALASDTSRAFSSHECAPMVRALHANHTGDGQSTVGDYAKKCLEEVKTRR